MAYLLYSATAGRDNGYAIGGGRAAALAALSPGGSSGEALPPGRLHGRLPGHHYRPGACRGRCHLCSASAVADCSVSLENSCVFRITFNRIGCYTRMRTASIRADTIVENDEIDTDTIIPTTSSQKSVTRHLYSPEELAVQLLRGFPRIDPFHPRLACDCVP